jgi:hypothetical protein
MGNECCCNRKVEEDESSKIQSLDNYLIYLLNKISEIQQIVSEYSGQNDPENYNNPYTISFEQYQFYIKLNNVLIKLKILLEDYKYSREANNTSSYKSQMDFKYKIFNLDKGKDYLNKILETQVSPNIRTLEDLDSKMKENIFYTDKYEKS